MTTILALSGGVLNFSAIVFALTYIWLNAFSKVTDLAVRNKSIINITKTAMILSIVFVFVSCLLSDASAIDEAIKRTAVWYSIIAISWLFVLVCSSLSMLKAFISKATFKSDSIAALNKIFTVALWGAILNVVFAWLM